VSSAADVDAQMNQGEHAIIQRFTRWSLGTGSTLRIQPLWR